MLRQLLQRLVAWLVMVAYKGDDITHEIIDDSADGADYIHVTPINDLVEHECDDDGECLCGPEVHPRQARRRHHRLVLHPQRTRRTRPRRTRPGRTHGKPARSTGRVRWPGVTEATTAPPPDCASSNATATAAPTAATPKAPSKSTTSTTPAAPTTTRTPTGRHSASPATPGRPGQRNSEAARHAEHEAVTRRKHTPA